MALDYCWCTVIQSNSTSSDCATAYNVETHLSPSSSNPFWVYSCRLILLTGWLGAIAAYWNMGRNIPFWLMWFLCRQPANCIPIVQLFTPGEGHNNKQETLKNEDLYSNSYCSNIEFGSQSPIRCQKKQTSKEIFDGFQEEKRKSSDSLDVLSSSFLSCTITFTISSGPPRNFKENLSYLSNLIR